MELISILSAWGSDPRSEDSALFLHQLFGIGRQARGRGGQREKVAEGGRRGDQTPMGKGEGGKTDDRPGVWVARE